jgi:hypothetical protein
VACRTERVTPPSTTYHREESAIKFIKAYYISNLKSYFNPKRELRKETFKQIDEAFVYMFCGRAGHLDEFYFWHKRIKKKCFDYARNSYRYKFINFLHRSYSRALSYTYSRTLPQFSHGSNHRSYVFDSRENRFVSRRFGYGSRPHRSDRFPRRPYFPVGEFHAHFEPRHLDGFCCLSLLSVLAQSSILCCAICFFS